MYMLKILVSYNQTFPTQACFLLRPPTSLSSPFQQYSSWKENIFLLSIFSFHFHCLLQFSFCFFLSNGAVHAKVNSIYFLMARSNFLISIFIVFDFEIIIQPPFCPWHCFKNCYIFYLVFNIILCIRCFIPYFIETPLDPTNCFFQLNYLSLSVSKKLLFPGFSPGVGTACALFPCVLNLCPFLFFSPLVHILFQWSKLICFHICILFLGSWSIFSMASLISLLP